MSVGLVQTLVNALLLLVVAFVGGTLGVRRFESLERSVSDLRTDVRTDIAQLPTELTADLTELRRSKRRCAPT